MKASNSHFQHSNKRLSIPSSIPKKSAGRKKKLSLGSEVPSKQFLRSVSNFSKWRRCYFRKTSLNLEEFTRPLYEAAEQLNSVLVLVGFLLVIVLKEEKKLLRRKQRKSQKAFFICSSKSFWLRFPSVLEKNVRLTTGKQTIIRKGNQRARAKRITVNVMFLSK